MKRISIITLVNIFVNITSWIFVIFIFLFLVATSIFVILFTTKRQHVLHLVEKHDYPALGKLLEENAESPSLEFYLQSCATCDKSPSFLTVTRAGMEKGRLVFADLLNTTLTPQEHTALLQEIKFSNK